MVIGPPGSGKTWLAQRIGEARGWPVHHFDEVGHVAGGGTPLRDAGILRGFTDQLATELAWVCEGVDVTWTGPAFAHADLILWLDEGGLRPAIRMVQRFLRQGLAEARRQRGRRRFLRFRDYARRIGQLMGSLGRSATYGHSPDAGAASETRAALATALAPHGAKVLRVASARERARVIRLLLGHDG